MSKNRRNFTPQQKPDIVRRHLKDKVPVSALAEELSIQPTQIYQWVAMVLEQADRPFEKTERGNNWSERAEIPCNALLGWARLKTNKYHT